MTERVAPGLGEAFGGYTIEALLGRGGMGAVYLATHARLDRKVALKVIAPELAHDEEFRARFLRETQLAASLEHSNVIPIYDAGEVDGVLYLAMRYIAGPSLRTLLREQGALSVERTLAIARQIGDALDAAHAAGLVHRDVKPANVLLSEADEHASLCDFGLARRSDSEGLTQTGSFLGTVEYAAPEQIEGRPVDGRADIYSLGCVLFHCLAGRPPYAGDTEYAILHAHVSDPVPLVSSERADAPRALDNVLLKALAKSPDARYATAGALADEFAAAVEATRAAPVIRSAGPRRRRLPAAIATLVVLVAAGVLGPVLATRGSSHDAAPSRPSLRATVLAIEHILRGSAVEHQKVATVLDAGFHCRISGTEVSSHMRGAVANRRQALEDVARIGTPPAAATKAVALLSTALRHSIRADADYRNGFRYTARGPCPPTSSYFTAASLEDRQATQAKIRFVAAFNPLAMRFGRTTWTAAAI